jgi:alpha-mannosidase
MEPEFVHKCLERGIRHPAGSFLQDLGWPAAPRLNREEIQYVTWREYMEEIAEAPTVAWPFTQEDIRCTLPWGEGTLQQMAREVRAAEIKILAAEKLASIAGVLRGYAYPEEKLQAAWDQLLLSQHHDAWICATTREGREHWAWQAGAQSWMAEMLCDGVLNEAMDLFRQEGDGEAAERVRIFNPSGVERKELTEIEIPLSGGAVAVRVRDAGGTEIPCQLVPTRTNREDGRIQACRLLFEAAAPAMGYQTYTIERVYSDDERTGTVPDGQRACASVRGDQVIVATDLYDIRIDIARGGVIASWFDKALNRSIVSADQPLNEYTGFLIEQNRWASSVEAPAEVTIKENGPLRVVVEIKGKFAETDFVTTLSAVKGRRRVDFHVRFRYERETWIGHPWAMAPEHRNTERRKSHHYTRFKLQARFPMKLDSRQLYKNSAFDVTRSRHEDTHYERWDEIKHNIILNWIDAYDERSNYGLAVFSDHTTDYSHGADGVPALTLGWGGEGGFWWGRRPLSGIREMRYALLPHGERWERAGIEQECASWMQPLIPMYGFLSGPSSASLFRVSDPSIEVSAVWRSRDDLFVRLYNSGPETSRFSLILSGEMEDRGICLTELDGRRKESLQSDDLPDRSREVKLSLVRHGLVTIQLHGFRAAETKS